MAQPCPAIITIGASAGGVEALSQLVEQLPPGLPAAVLVAIHFPANSTSLLPKILNQLGTLPARHPQDGECIKPGQIYAALPDHHLLVQPQTLYLSRGPRENGHRPAIDSLFRSAAKAYGARVIGVVLSGMLDDGAAGLKIIRASGGRALVQDPQEATFDSMPRSAIAAAAVEPEAVLSLSGIAARLVELTKDCLEDEDAMPEKPEREQELVAQNKTELEQGKHPGSASPLTCPDCGGVLWELRDNGMVRFRCHVGHAYSLDSLQAEQNDSLERALWSALRALEEKAALSRRMATHARAEGRARSEAQFLERASETEQQAALLREAILNSVEDGAEQKVN